MLDVLFLSVWFSILIFSVFLFRFSKKSILSPSVISILFGFIVLFQYLGFPILHFKLDDYRAEFVTDSTLTIWLFFVNSLTLLFLLIGYIFSSKSVSTKKKKKARLIKTSKRIPLETLLSTIIIFFSSFSVFLVYVHSVGLSNLVISKVIAGSNIGVMNLARSEMTNAFSGRYHWYKVFMNDLLFISSASLFLISKARPKFLFSCFSFFSILVCIFSSFITGEKAKIVDFFLVMLISATISKRNPRFNIKSILFSSILLISVLSGSYAVFMGIGSFSSAISSIVSRVLTGQIQPGYHYLEFFPQVEDYLLGRSFPNPAGIFQFKPYNLTQEIMAWVNPMEEKLGITGSMPTFFWGELYANFGFLSIPIGAFLTGFYLQFLDMIISASNRFNPLTAAFSAWIMVHFKDLAMTGISAFIIDFYLVICCIIILGCRFLFKQIILVKI